jgi:hypothetical protein
MEMESVKISKALLKKIRKHVKSTGQTISGYINVRLGECIQQDSKEKRTLDELGELNERV